MLAVVDMSAAWRAHGTIPQFFIKKDSECLSFPAFFLFLVSFVCMFLCVRVDYFSDIPNYVVLCFGCRSLEGFPFSRWS